MPSNQPAEPLKGHIAGPSEALPQLEASLETAPGAASEQLVAQPASLETAPGAASEQLLAQPASLETAPGAASEQLLAHESADTAPGATGMVSPEQPQQLPETAPGAASFLLASLQPTRAEARARVAMVRMDFMSLLQMSSGNTGDRDVRRRIRPVRGGRTCSVPLECLS